MISPTPKNNPTLASLKAVENNGVTFLSIRFVSINFSIGEILFTTLAWKLLHATNRNGVTGLGVAESVDHTAVGLDAAAVDIALAVYVLCG